MPSKLLSDSFACDLFQIDFPNSSHCTDIYFLGLFLEQQFIPHKGQERSNEFCRVTRGSMTMQTGSLREKRTQQTHCHISISYHVPLLLNRIRNVKINLVTFLHIFLNVCYCDRQVRQNFLKKEFFRSLFLSMYCVSDLTSYSKQDLVETKVTPCSLLIPAVFHANMNTPHTMLTQWFSSDYEK